MSKKNDVAGLNRIAERIQASGHPIANLHPIVTNRDGVVYPPPEMEEELRDPNNVWLPWKYEEAAPYIDAVLDKLDELDAADNWHAHLLWQLEEAEEERSRVRSRLEGCRESLRAFILMHKASRDDWKEKWGKGQGDA